MTALRLALAAAAVALALPTAASAKMFLVFDRAAAAPGQTVRVHVPARFAPEARGPLGVYLVRVSAAPEIRSPADGRLVRVGVLRDGRLGFHLPRLVAGRYTTAFGDGSFFMVSTWMLGNDPTAASARLVLRVR